MDQRVHIVFPQHCSDIFLATRPYCFASVSVSLKKTYAIPPLNTTQSGKLPSFVATVSRRHPVKRFRNHVYHCLIGKISFMGLQLLPSRFRCCRRLCDGRWRRSRRVGRGLFAARRAREVRLLANRGLTRKQRRRLRVLFRAFQPNWTSSSLSLCVRTDPAAPCTPCFRMCWSVKRPSFHRYVEK